MAKRLCQGERRAGGRRSTFLVTLPCGILCLLLVLAACGAPSSAMPAARGASTGLAVSQSVSAFDPSVGAPLPDYRIVAAYGIVGGVDFNGPASTLDMLTAFYPQLQQLGNQYAALDPTHPVKLAIDLVVNGIQPCSEYPTYCSSWTDNATMQTYIEYCQQHNMLLFFDLQLGTETVKDAVMNHVLTYLEKYPFVELALDTEFHFPATTEGYADAEGYPCCLGWMNASEINWAEDELAQISLQYHLPRKVLLIHQWNPAVLPDKDNIQTNPDVSLVLQSDGFGGYGNKLGDYQVFVQQDLLEYGGYKLFFYYSDGSTAYDFDYNGNKQVQSPQQVMQLFPQPLFISYQ
ncbi:MAG: hypothetical protein ACLQUY_13390 [Ktedonobacterales bacterium]